MVRLEWKESPSRLVAGTSVPSARVGYLLAGIGVFFVTQAVNLFINAVRIGPTGAGFDGSAHDGDGLVEQRSRQGRRRA